MGKTKADQKKQVLGKLVEQIQIPGDGIYAMSEVPKAKTPKQASLIEAAKVSHPKFAQVLREIAESADLDVTIKTVLLIKPKKKNKGE